MAKTAIRWWVRDTYIRSYTDYTNTNYRNEAVVYFDYDPGDARAYIKINPYVIPLGKKITKIIIGLWRTAAGTELPLYGAKLLKDVDIDMVTWNTKPPCEPTLNVGTLLATADEQRIDVTQYFGLTDLIRGIVLWCVTATSVGIYSADYIDPNKQPYIEIEYADAPDRPSVVGPMSGTAIDKTVTAASRFEWAHNPSDVSQLPQKSYELQWSTDAYTWTTVSATTANAYADVDVSVMPAGAIIWRVRIIDTDDVPSDWSEQQIIRIASIPAAPNITNAVFDKASPKIEWTIAEQSGYQIQILQGADTLIDTIVTTADKFFNVPIVLDNSTQFTVKVRCKNNSDVFSAWAEDAISTAYTAPSIPTLAIVKKKYSVELNITGDAPLYQIYRDTVLIGTTTTSKYEDWSAPFGTECSYKVVAVGEGTAESAVAKGTTDYPNESVLTLVSDPTKTFSVKWNITYSRDISDDGVLVEYAGRELPCMELGEHMARTYTIDAHMVDMTTYESLETMVKNRSLFLFRRKDVTMYGRPTNIVAAKPDYMRNDFTLSFVLNEVAT
jgi:hypothetical protein